MGHPRSRRSGQHYSTFTDLSGPGDLEGSDGGGTSRLPPTTPTPTPTPTPPRVDEENEVTTSPGATRSQVTGHHGVTVTSGVSLTSTSVTSVTSVLQVPTPSSGTLRNAEESLPLLGSVNRTLQRKGKTEDTHKHTLISSPPDTPLHVAPPSPLYLTATPTHPHTPHTLLPHLNEDIQRTYTPQNITTTTKRSNYTRRSSIRNQRSALSEKRVVQPTSAPSNLYSVCQNNPCGVQPSCHADPSQARGFLCFCDDNSVVEPGMSCSSRGRELKEHPSPPPLFHKEMEPNYIIWPMGLASVLVVAVLLFTFWRRKCLCAWLKHRHREKKPSQQPQDTISKSNSLVAYNFASNPNYYTQGPDIQTVHTLPVHLLHPEQISFIGELGEGCFGKVYKGTYTQCCPETISEGGDEEGGGGRGRGSGRNQREGGDDSDVKEEEEEEEEEEDVVTQTVAVKVIKESVGVKGEEDFMREVEIMSAFSHPNILTLIGIVAKGSGGTPWMVFEYMPYGDLAELLRSCGPHFYSNHTPVTSLCKSDLLHISIQIASGMEYLSSQHFVHRDLACRNCLVGEDLTVKISDFGMSRDVYTCDYYKVGGSRMLPVRWMAPESIMYGKFTLESDVWSFGVVLWEIYSFGKQPYYGNSNENVVKLIFQGILLVPPDTCPPKVCDVMKRCWATDPTDRLKFPDILDHLKGLRDEGKDVYPHDISPHPSTSPCSPPVTYSQLCLQEETGAGQLDQDLYLVPRRVEYREYITVLNV